HDGLPRRPAVLDASRGPAPAALLLRSRSDVPQLHEPGHGVPRAAAVYYRRWGMDLPVAGNDREAALAFRPRHSPYRPDHVPGSLRDAARPAVAHPGPARQRPGAAQ